MLHTETVEPKTLNLLKKLMNDEKLNDFNLVGGTSLSLQLGHRMSIDLDLFSSSLFSVDDLRDHLKRNYENVEERRTNDYTLITQIEGIKVDFLSYQYPLLKNLIDDKGIRLYSLDDIAAMKLSAVSRTGKRLKDFVDIASLSTRFSLNEMLEKYAKKFNNPGLTIHIIRSIGYHSEINHGDVVNMVNSTYNWESIQNRLSNMIDNPNNIYQSLPVKQDLKKDFSEAALNNDFKTIMQLKEKGFVYSMAIASELKEAGVGDYAMIAIQNVFGIKEPEPTQANNPQNAVLREAIANSDFTKMVEMKNSGYKPSKEFMNELIQDKSIHDNTKIAINKIFGLNMIKHSIADIKLAKSEPEINKNQTKSKDNNLQK